MNNLRSILIADARQTLLRELSSTVGRNDVYEAFAAWLTGDSVSGLRVSERAASASKTTGAERTSQNVATLGFASQATKLEEQEIGALKSGLRWIVGCDPVISGTPMPFCMDAVTLAGVMLAAKWSADQEVQGKVGQWIQRCRDATKGGQGLGEWQEWLLGIVGREIGIDWTVKAGDGAEAAEVRVALRSRGIGDPCDYLALEKDEIEAINAILNQTASSIGVPHAAVRLAALDWIKRVRPITDLKTVTVSDLCELLRRVPAAFKKWTWEHKPRTKTSPEPRKWHVDNEYHVQNMLWLLLEPIFPDLDDEVHTRKIGAVQPRADICIPSLRVIVEAKFMRSDDTTKSMIRQIGEDASLYLVEGSEYDAIIPFIWDDSRRSELHDELIRGLRQIDGVIDSIVVSRPGSMTDTTA